MRITYIEASGTAHDLDVPAGWTVMEGAVRNGVRGIPADCGGSCACGTCRVYLAEDWQLRLGGPGDLEAATLEIHDDDTPGQRLSCQIPVSDAIDGLVVRIPKR